MDVTDLRSFIRALEDASELKRVRRQVDARLELAAVVRASELSDGPALLFEDVKGSKIPVVSGLLSNVERAAIALGVGEEDLLPRISGAVEAPMKPKVVEDGPVRENIHKNGIDLLKMFPIPIHAEKDAGPYISAGVVVSKNPETGRMNLSYNRMQVKGPKRLGFKISKWRDIGDFFEEKEKVNQALEIAICIGVDPVIEMAAATKVPFDEYELASSLRGSPAELVGCETVDLKVPASAEVVIEGRILPKVREKESPFAEYLGYYSTIQESPVVEVTAVTHRDKPIFRTIVGASMEHVLLGNILTREPLLYKFVKHAVPTVKGVRLTPQSGGYHAIISIEQRNEGEARNAILAALTSHVNIKHVIVVDDDVNVNNMKDVEWAIASRFQGDRDLIVIPGARGIASDPSSKNGVSAKVGIDATKPLDAPLGAFERVKWPTENINLKDYLAD
ncbi:MAG TPA: UbiD family decarboxylase [Candidatus Bathyarchaeia archaeon]|nr:UbiD family decarboxylase [Candidatus Bathyarchaeia archaeon]